MGRYTHSMCAEGNDMATIKISRDFTDTPGGRYIIEGEYSGEDFRDRLLYPKLLEAKGKGEILTIDFDGSYGYGTSFLEEAFGGIVRKYKVIGLLNMIAIISNDDETIEPSIREYVHTEEKKIS